MKFINKSFKIAKWNTVTSYRAIHKKFIDSNVNTVNIDKLEHYDRWTIQAGSFVDYLFFPTPRIHKYSEISNLKGYFLSSVGAGTIDGKIKACWGGDREAYDSLSREMYSSDVTTSDFAKPDISKFRATGGDIILSFGGETLPIESKIINTTELVEIYNEIIKNYSLRAIDFNFNQQFLINTEAVYRHIETIKKVKSQNSEVKLSYTLPVAEEKQSIGGFNLDQKAFLKKLHDNNIKLSLINGLVVSTGSIPHLNLFEATKIIAMCMHKDISEIWKEWNTADIWSHIGICPMFGKNPNGQVFTIEDQKKLNEWATYLNIACLNGWDATRDHNPDCIGLIHHDSGQFGKILSEYKPIEINTELTGQTENIDDL